MLYIYFQHHCMFFIVSVHVLLSWNVGVTWTSEISCFASYRSERLNNMLSAVSSIWVTRRSNDYAIHDFGKCFLPSTKCLLSCAVFPHHRTSTQQLGYQKHLWLLELFQLERVLTWISPIGNLSRYIRKHMKVTRQGLLNLECFSCFTLFKCNWLNPLQLQPSVTLFI